MVTFIDDHHVGLQTSYTVLESFYRVVDAVSRHAGINVVHGAAGWRLMHCHGYPMRPGHLIAGHYACCLQKICSSTSRIERHPDLCKDACTLDEDRFLFEGSGGKKNTADGKPVTDGQERFQECSLEIFANAAQSP